MLQMISVADNEVEPCLLPACLMLFFLASYHFFISKHIKISSQYIALLMYKSASFHQPAPCYLPYILHIKYVLQAWHNTYKQWELCSLIII
jgi:hypothetical protein